MNLSEEKKVKGAKKSNILKFAKTSNNSLTSTKFFAVFFLSKGSTVNKCYFDKRLNKIAKVIVQNVLTYLMLEYEAFCFAVMIV
jgi:hypothetical protein